MIMSMRGKLFSDFNGGLIILVSRHFNRTLTIFSFAVFVSTIFALFKQYIPIFFIAATAYGFWRKDGPGAILGLLGSVLVFFVDAWVMGSLLALAKGAPVGDWLFKPDHVAFVFLTGKGTEFELSARGAWLMAQPLLVVIGAFLAMFRLRFFDLIPAGGPVISGRGEYGNARWATNTEIRARFTGSGPGILLGKYMGRLLIVPPRYTGKGNLNVFVIGLSGAGKSTNFIIPNILQAVEGGESIVVTDPARELFEVTAGFLIRRGYRVIVFDIIEKKFGHRYNFMKDVKEYSDGLRLARTIIQNTTNPYRIGGDDFWDQAEENLICALILAVAHDPERPSTLAEVLRLGVELGLENNNEEVLDVFFERLPHGHPAKGPYGIFKTATPRTRGCILTGFGTRLRVFHDPYVIGLTADSDFDLADLGRERVALFVFQPDSDRTYDVLGSLLFTELFHRLYELAGNKPLPVPVRFLLDEFCNIGYIPDFTVKISTMRKRGISCSLIVQEVAQIQNRYGVRAADEIIGNCMTTLYMGSGNRETNKWLSDRMGPATILVEGRSYVQGKTAPTISRNYHQRPLLMPDEIERLPQDKLIILQIGHYPVMAERFFYKYHPFAGYLGVDTPELPEIPQARPPRYGRIRIGTEEAREERVRAPEPDSGPEVPVAGREGRGEIRQVNIFNRD